MHALGVTNFEILGFVPLGCVASGMTFYDQVMVKALGPVAAIGLLACPPLYNTLRGQPSDEANRTSKRFGLLLLELTLPSITTALIQVLLCSQFDDGAFVRDELTLACDDSDHRVRWVTIACIGLVVYPLGGELRNIFNPA